MEGLGLAATKQAKGIGCGFATTGAGLGNNIFAVNQRRQGLRLNRCHGGKTCSMQPGQ